MTAVVAVTTCCGSIATAALRGGSPVAAVVLPVALGALDERRLVGTDASNLSALAGARGGTVGATLRTQNKRIRLLPLETGASGGEVAYLKVEKSRFLFLEGSMHAVVAAGVATATLPDASVVCAGASATRVAPSVDRLVAGASAPTPGACSSAASAAFSEGGAGSHLSGGAAPYRFLPLLPLPMTITPRSPGDRAPAARAAGIPHPTIPGAPAAGSFAPSCMPPALAPTATPHACVRARGVGRSDRAVFTATLC
jgi:hypothetical protein